MGRRPTMNNAPPIEVPRNPAQCQKCGKYFGRPASVTRHARLHDTNAPRYPCPVEGCTRANATVQSGDQRRHMRLKHGILWCGKQISAPGDPEILCDFQTRDAIVMATHKELAHKQKRKSSPFIEMEERPAKKARRSEHDSDESSAGNGQSTSSSPQASASSHVGSTAPAYGDSPAAAGIGSNNISAVCFAALSSGELAAATWASPGDHRPLQRLQERFQKAGYVYDPSYQRDSRSAPNNDSISRSISPIFPEHFEGRSRNASAHPSIITQTEAQAEGIEREPAVARRALIWSIPRRSPPDMQKTTTAGPLADDTRWLEHTRSSARSQSQPQGPPSGSRLIPASWDFSPHPTSGMRFVPHDDGAIERGDDDDDDDDDGSGSDELEY